MLCATPLSAYSVIGVNNFFAFLCVSEHFESIETHFFFENFRELRATREARHESKGAKFFFAFLRVSEDFESIKTHFFFFENFREREAQNAH